MRRSWLKVLAPSAALLLVGLALMPGVALRAFAPGWNATLPADGGALWAPDIRANWDAVGRTLGSVNLIADSTFLIWPAGDAAAPAHWTLVNTPTPARIGTGLADTNRKVGAYALKLTSGVSLGSARQNILPSGAYDDGFDGLTLSFGAWVMASAATTARVGIGDGVGTSYCQATVSPSCTGYHTGGGTWEWLTGTRTVNSAATSVYLTLDCAASQVCRFSAPTVLLGETPPSYYQPSPTTILSARCFLAGVQTTGTRKVGSGCDFYFTRPAIVRDAWVSFTTVVPTGANYIVDVNHFDGAAFQTMYSTRPTVTAGNPTSSTATPDGTYRYRCFTARTGTSQTDTLMTVDVDQIGSGNAGTDATIEIRYLVFSRPLENFLRGTDIN